MKGIQQISISLILTTLLFASSYQENFHWYKKLPAKRQSQVYEQAEKLQFVSDAIFNHVNNGNDFKSGDQTLWFLKKQFGDLVSCNLCWYSTQEFDSYVNTPQHWNMTMNSLVNVCEMIGLRNSTCEGYIYGLGPIIKDNLMKLILTPDYMCAEVLKFCSSDPYLDLDPQHYISQMLADKPASIQNDSFVNDLYQQILNDPSRETRPTLKIVQFTDIHMDLQYSQGANIHCDNIICCRPGDGFPTDPNSQAGKYGSPGCDIPIDVVTTMGEYINANLKPDVIFYTGDVPPHDQWAYTLEYVTSLQTRLADFFKANFTDVALYPLEGNHDWEVANSQDFSTPDPMIAVNLELWDQYLDEEAKIMYAKVGYYTQKLKLKNGKTYDNVNIVAVNTQPCYNMNFYLFGERDDPGGVLAWLNATLRQFEDSGEIAIIISHVPPGDSSCLYQWAVRYKSIMDRFQHIVRFSVFGHVHAEVYGVAKAVNSSKPIGVHLWASSVSTWFANNPSFRMIEVDEATMLPVRAHTYVLHVRNETYPDWKWDHELTQLYNMTDLSPSSFIQLSNQILNDEQKALTYLHKMSANGEATDYASCDEACRKNLYCSTTNTVYFESKDCMGEQRLDIQNDPVSTVMEYLSDPWVEKNPSYFRNY